MNRRIVFTRPDGGVSVVTPARCVNDTDLTDDEIFQRAWQKLPQDAIEPRLVFVEDIPSDRTFRDAWKHDRERVVVDMDKARVIHMDRIRKARDLVLSILDIETLKAVGKGDQETLAVTEAQKQFLRNIPQTLDLSKAKTPDELKIIWPSGLKLP